MSTTILSITHVLSKVNKPFHFSELNFYKEKSENASVKKHHATKSELCEAKKRKQHSNKNKSKLGASSLSKSKSSKNDVFEERSRTISCNICISDNMCHHPATLLFSESNTSSIEMSSYLLRNEQQEIFQSAIGGFPGDMNNNNNFTQRY